MLLKDKTFLVCLRQVEVRRRALTKADISHLSDEMNFRKNRRGKLTFIFPRHKLNLPQLGEAPA